MTSEPPIQRRLHATFALTSALSAFLLFLVQPLIGKVILPWFGGGPGIWTTTLFFFQVVLLAGYLYAHLLSSRLSLRAQVALHCVLLLVALVSLPITPEATWKPHAGDDPTTRILGLLLFSVGLPYFVLSATAPLLQRWFGEVFPSTPYRLYALSNAASLLALLSYPLVVEPRWDVIAQSHGWSYAFALFSSGVAMCAVGLLSSRRSASPTADPTGPTVRSTWRQRALWFSLSFVPSWMLLAITNQLCLDVAAVPFLWIAPLAIYLLSFVACFGTNNLYRRAPFVVLWLLTTTALGVHLLDPTRTPLQRQLAIYLLTFVACAMLCHGELSRRRPALAQLTDFYLWLALGGAAGGGFVSLVAPRVFTDYYELHWGVIACYVLVLLVLFQDGRDAASRRINSFTALAFGVNAILLSMAAMLTQGADPVAGRTIEQVRNFYGTLRVSEKDGQRIFTHGRIWHGIQRTEVSRRGEVMLYHGADSGIARLLNAPRADARSHRIGVIGLGVGVLARYGRSNDVMRFYELDPDVIRIAREHFSFVEDSAARVELVEGDGRLSLEREAPQGFDVLAIDAFSSDAIPVHLFTIEAFQIYRSHLRDDGVLAVHVSNRYLDLVPVVLSAAKGLDMSARVVRVAADYEHLVSASTWLLLAHDAWRVNYGTVETAAVDQPWSDARSSLFQAIRWR